MYPKIPVSVTNILCLLVMLLQEALEKKEEELDALKLKNQELDQSLSQMSVDKEEMDRIGAKLKETEEQLTQANRELQAYKEKVHRAV